MKTMKKLMPILMVVALIIMLTAPIAFAETSAKNPSEIPVVESAQTGTIESLGGQIIRIISVIGSVVSIIVLIVLGIKYMMGSAEERAEYKKTLLPYIIGASLVFAASAIAGVIYGFASQINDKAASLPSSLPTTAVVAQLDK